VQTAPYVTGLFQSAKATKGKPLQERTQREERKSIRAKGKLATIALALVFLAVVAVGFAQKEPLFWMGAAEGETMGLIAAFVLLK